MTSNGITYHPSPVGDLLIESANDKIVKIHFVRDNHERLHVKPSSVIERCIAELDEYFYKGRKFFTFPIELQGTDFQRKVWTELTKIPYGKTISYQEQAIRVGDLKSTRAVASANGMNPIAIVVPCHRVIGKDGTLTGFGGGLDNKEWLLEHEGSRLKQLSLF